MHCPTIPIKFVSPKYKSSHECRLNEIDLGLNSNPTALDCFLNEMIFFYLLP